MVRLVVTHDKARYAYDWSQAFDPMGWLYGGAILAFQAGVKGQALANSGVLPWVCHASAAICLLLLIAAMTERGQGPAWTPPRSLTLIAVALVGVILLASFRVQAITLGAAA